MGLKKLFISYSRRDTDYVSTLVDGLRKQGFDVWFDKNIQSGTDWDDSIEQELKNADAIVLILSRTSVASENVKDEMSYGIGLEKPVIPIKIEECDVPMRLARKQFVDFTSMGQEAGFERLVKDLHLSLAQPVKPVLKGTFNPPKNTTGNNLQPQGSKKIMPYIIGGVASIIIFIVFAVTCTDGTNSKDDTDTDIYNSLTLDTGNSSNAAWDIAVQNNTVDGYLNYIYTYGVMDSNYKAAKLNIDSLWKWNGLVLYSDMTAHYLVKNLYTNMNGDFVYATDDKEHPKEGDILTVLKTRQVYDVITGELISGVTLKAGSKAKVNEIREDDEGNVWVVILYPENPL